MKKSINNYQIFRVNYVNWLKKLVLLCGLLIVLKISISPSNSSQAQSDVNLQSIISNGQFVYGQNVYDFDLEIWLASRPTDVAYLYNIIQKHAGYYSISPKVLITILELEEGLFSQSANTSNYTLGSNEDLGYDLDKFDERVESIALELAEKYYHFSHQNDPDEEFNNELKFEIEFSNGKKVFNQNIDSASHYALFLVLAQDMAFEDWSKIVSSTHPEGFYITYKRLFPGDDPLDPSNNINVISSPPQDLLGLPFECQDSWLFSNGPHNWTPVTSRPWSSVDFAPASGNCQSPPTDDWIVAAAGGVVNVIQPYHIRVIHNSEWQTDYYHLTNLQVSGGESISKGQRLGNPSCEGGVASGPHVHFALLQQGQRVDIAGTALSGWVVHEKNPPIHGDGYLQKGGTVIDKGQFVLSENCNGCCGCLSSFISSEEFVEKELQLLNEEEIFGPPALITNLSNMTSISPEEKIFSEITIPSTPTISSLRNFKPNDWLSDDQFHISWTSTRKNEGKLMGYIVQFSRIGSDEIGNQYHVEPSTYNYSFNPKEDGKWMVRIKAVDQAGNESEPAEIGPFLIDRTPPQMADENIQVISWNSEAVSTFEWVEAVDAHSGIDGYLIYWGEDEAGQGEHFISEPRFGPEMPLVDDRAATYYLRVAPVDVAGNVGEWQTTAVWQYDNAAPSGSIAVDHGADVVKSLHTGLVLTAADQGSGVSEMRLSTDGQNWSTWQPYQERFQWTLADIPFEQKVFAQLRDAAGNVSDVLETAVRVDLRLDQPSSSNYQISRSVMAMGGSEKSSASYTVQSTTGQPHQSSQPHGSSYQVYSGFLSPNSAPFQISLPQGWNLVSSFVEPENPQMDVLFSGLMNNLVLVKNGDGQIYWPDYNVNQIGSWDIKEAYWIYVASPSSLSIQGSFILPQNVSIHLNQGWNQIPYLRSNPMAIESALASIQDEIYLVKNGAGEVYWPDMEIYNLGTLQPKQGYQIYLTNDSTLVYPSY